MTYIAKPSVHHPALPKNALGLTRRDYEGTMSTLCAGCGHDSITAAVIEACFELDLPAHRIAKLSGIGCSSKAPTYFLQRSHGFNSVHGRMPSVTTGAYLANSDLIYLGVSGDGDTASIGLGQFAHAVRRKLNMTYIVMNNGCYGLTKGQFSATNDKASPSKKGEANPFEAIDLCQMAIQLGAGFVARSFSGDKTQLVPLIKAAIRYRGFAFLDVISPCVTFNNHAASTKSYEWVRAHNQAVDNELDFVAERDEITASYGEGTTFAVEMHDGSMLRLHKLDGGHDPRDANQAILTIRERAQRGEVATGLLYFNERQEDLHGALGTDRRPLNSIPMAELCPGARALDGINARLG
jgi:2-oxoglutarate ferredoxin oxidoreductase subunit beta